MLSFTQAEESSKIGKEFFTVINFYFKRTIINIEDIICELLDSNNDGEDSRRIKREKLQEAMEDDYEESRDYQTQVGHG